MLNILLQLKLTSLSTDSMESAQEQPRSAVDDDSLGSASSHSSEYSLRHTVFVHFSLFCAHVHILYLLSQASPRSCSLTVLGDCLLHGSTLYHQLDHVPHFQS